MINKELLQAILLRLDSLTSSSDSPVNNTQFNDLAEEKSILTHLDYLITNNLIEGNIAANGQRIESIKFTEKGREKLLTQNKLAENTKAQSDAQEDPIPRRVWVPALIFTSLLILFLITAFFFTPKLTADQRDLIRFLSALLAGLSTHFLGGMALLQVHFPKNKAIRFSLSATAGIAVFVLFYLISPYWYKQPLSLELIETPQGFLLGKADLDTFQVELQKEASKLTTEAEHFFRAAETDYSSKRFRDAEGNYKKSIDLIPTKSAYLNLGFTYFLLSDYKAAEDTFISGLRLAEKRGDNLFRARFLDALGSNYFFQGNTEEALRSIDAAIELFKEQDELHTHGYVLAVRAIILRDIGKNEEAKEGYLSALEVSKSDPNFDNSRRLKALALSNLGIIYTDELNLPEALTCYKSALEIHKQRGITQGIISTLGNISSVYMLQGKYTESLEAANEALNVAKDTNTLAYQVLLLNNISNLYLEQRDLMQATLYAKEASSVAQKIKSPFVRGYLAVTFGLVYLENKEFDKAIRSTDEGLKLLQTSNHLPGQAEALVALGRIYLSMDKTDEALNFYTQALDLAKQNNFLLSKANALGGIGTIYNLQGQKQKALEHLKQAVEIYVNAGVTSRELQAFQALLQ